MVGRSLIKMPGRALAQPAAQVGGLALINDELAGIAEALQIAERCRQIIKDHSSLGAGDIVRLGARMLDHAKPIHKLLAGAAKLDCAHSTLLSIIYPRERISHADAIKMLAVLFSAMSRKKSDAGETAMKLAACADMFDPVSEAVGKASGLWKPVPKHPVMLALAIKHLMATSVWAPSECELREAMKTVRDRLLVMAHHIGEVVSLINRADMVVFTFDRAAWNAAYADARISASIIAVMSDDSEQLGEDGEPPTPRWKALDDLWEAKYAAEEAALIAADERKQITDESTSTKIAACKTTLPAKKTRKLKEDA